MKSHSTTNQLKLLARHIAGVIDTLKLPTESEAPDATSRLKLLDAMLRVKKAMLETRLLEEELRLRQRQGGSDATSRKAGISPEALEEIGRVLGLTRPNEPTQNGSPAAPSDIKP
jgi:hypothetical protein